MRRCSGESTRKRPPKLQYACPPRFASDSWSTSVTVAPASQASVAATSPDSPAPMTSTSDEWGDMEDLLVMRVRTFRDCSL
jgi:hypothetical protein